MKLCIACFFKPNIWAEINKEANNLAILILREKKGRKEGKNREGEKERKEREKEAREGGREKERGKKGGGAWKLAETWALTLVRYLQRPPL